MGKTLLLLCSCYNILGEGLTEVLSLLARALITNVLKDCGERFVCWCSELVQTAFLLHGKFEFLDIDLLALHYVYSERINKHIAEWTNAWNKHPISTERNLSPLQMWTAGLIHMLGSGSIVGEELEADAFEDMSQVCVSHILLNVYMPLTRQIVYNV